MKNVGLADKADCYARELSGFLIFTFSEDISSKLLSVWKLERLSSLLLVTLDNL